MRNSKNLIRHELIGLDCEIVGSPNPFQEGIKGRVVDEGMNVLVVRTEKGDKNVQKKSAEIMFMLNGEKVRVDGNWLIARPEDRIKKRMKKW